MSNVSNRHNVVPFISGESTPLTGQRLAKVGYKSTKNQPAKFPSVCVSVPPVQLQEITNNINRLIPYIIDLVQETQDKIVRSLYESSHGSLSSVSDDNISISQVIGYLEAESTGGRLTKEYLEGWFDTNLRDNLTVVIAEKLSFEELNDDNIIIVNRHIAGYRDLISSLSGGKTILQPAQIKSLKNVLKLSSSDDDTVSKLNNKLDKMSEKKNVEELLEL